MANAINYETWNPNFYFDVVHGALPSDELRARTTKLIYTDNDRSYDTLEWELVNNDGLLTRTEYLALGLIVRVRFGYTEYTSGWKAFVISRAKGGVGVAGRAHPAVGESACLITLEGRNRNAPDAKSRGKKKGGGGTKAKGSKKGGLGATRVSRSRSGTCAALKPTGKGTGCYYPGRGGGSTGDITNLENLKRDAFTGPTEGQRIFMVKHLSEAVREIALRNGYADAQIFVQDTDDELNSVVIPTGLTDSDFLDEVANELDWVYKAGVDRFHFHSKDWRREEGTPKHTFVYGMGRDIIELTIDGDFRLPAPRSAKAVTRNPVIRRTQVGTANHENTGVVNRYATLYYLDDTKRAGPAAADRDQNTRRDFVFPATGGGTKMVTHKAESAFIQKNVRALKIRLRLVGNPSVLARDIVELKGTGCQLVDGDWYVGQAKHIFDGSTYVTELELRQPPKAKKGGKQMIIRAQLKGERGVGSTNPAAAVLYAKGTRAELKGAGLLPTGQ